MLDYLIKNAMVVDGTGKAAYQAHVGVKGDRIAAIIADETLPEAKKVIEAEGQLLTPGFIDVHSHADVSLPVYPGGDNSIMQGVTTFVGGNCGMGVAPAYNEEFSRFYVLGQLQMKGYLNICWKSFGEWLDYVRSFPIGPNYAPLVGHNAIRGSVMGLDYNRVATDEEVEKINSLLKEALDAGAFGMSYSSDPGFAGHCADLRELKSLFKQLEERGSYVTAHTRHHQNQWPSDDGRHYYGVYIGEPGEVLCGRYHGLLEFMELFKETPKLTACYSHLTNAFLAPMPHSQAMENAMLDETMCMFVDEPAAKGYKIYFNVLPHQNSLSGIRKVVYDLSLSLAYDKELKNYTEADILVNSLKDQSFREKLKVYIKSGKFKMNMTSPATDPYWADCFTFFTAKDESLLNKTLMDVTKERTNGPTAEMVYTNCLDVLFDLIVADPDLEWALTCDKREYMATDRLLSNRRGMPMTDSPSFPEKSDKWLSPMDYGNPPLSYTAMIRYLVDICREGKVISTEEAIRRITTQAAEMVGIAERGYIGEGMKADLVLMDWEKLNYVIDFNNPSTPPTGIRYVFVNGNVALEEGRLTHVLSGEVLTKQSIQKVYD
jgi:N-acyl-D-amino-acid deacylase